MVKPKLKVILEKNYYTKSYERYLRWVILKIDLVDELINDLTIEEMHSILFGIYYANKLKWKK